MNYRLQKKIDNYHAGKMTADEASSFEQELAKNPALLSESNFQKEIVDGLKSYRKSQLKSRLDAVNLTPTWIEPGSWPVLVKSFLAVSVAVIIGVGVYFYKDSGEETSPADVIVDAPEPIIFDWNVTPAQIPDKEVLPLKIASEITKANQKVEKLVTDEMIPEEEKEGFIPSFEAPDATNMQDEEAMQTSPLDELPGDELRESITGPVDVYTEINGDLDIKYKYYDGKLFLSGDFDRDLYEILEINSASGRRIYVKYLNKYYKVETTYKLSALPEVTDRKIIEELKLLRKSK
ncbi:MAG: hypothetical protein GDA51_11825 [Ekhidna sp.]|nr:hypothetical protein [Ekhidna sp.]MBC6409679.1 hypothetical protein [Ekhidna sp.]MBC6427123.1 hypothetical protein [Ekhidna sp.]